MGTCATNETVTNMGADMAALPLASILVFDIGGSHISAGVCGEEYRLGPVVSAPHPAEQTSDAFLAKSVANDSGRIFAGTDHSGRRHRPRGNLVRSRGSQGAGWSGSSLESFVATVDQPPLAGAAVRCFIDRGSPDRSGEPTYGDQHDI